MDWTDQGIVLSARRHGESGVIAMLLTRHHGRHAGLARGNRIRRALLPGTHVDAHWRARLAENLGSYSLEPSASPAASVIDDPCRLAALASACALLETAVPERQAYPGVFDGLAALLEMLDGPVWDAAYVQWEIGLLAALGFGLDLGRCAATGRNDDLAYVSPRTGRAVSLAAAEPYRDKLLQLPGFLIGRGGGDPSEVIDGLALTGHFLQRWVYAQAHQPIPAARERYVERYRKMATTSGRLPPP